MEMIESFATMLLADSFWSRWEDDDLAIDLLTQEEREQFRQSYAGPGCEIVQGMQDGICDLEIDLKSFLPLEMTQKIVDSVNEFWKGKYSVQQLHEYCERASHRLILGRVGHGVDADDDTDIAEMFKELGIEIPRSYHESPYEQAENLVREVEKNLAAKQGHVWAEISTGKYQCRILVQNIGVDQAWFSVKATNLDTYKSDWVTGLDCISTLLGEYRWKNQHDGWKIPSDDAISHLQTILNVIEEVQSFRDQLNKELAQDEEKYDWI